MIRRRLQHWQQESSNMSVGIPALVFSSTMIESDGDSGLCTQSTSDHEDVDRDDDGGETFCRFGRVERHRYLILFVLVTLVKLLLVSSYVSTDFDVHQHWLWITHHLPVRRWYLDTSSQWTLDYPPFFAWFECALSYVLAAICPELVKHYSLPLRSFNAILVHRLSVITCDLMLAWACYLYARWWLSTQVRQPHFVRDQLFSPALALGFLLLWNPALLLLDHIHFQYNGMLTGLLLLAITLIVSDQPLKGAVVFAVLLNFKHLYLYVAPAFFVYLLRVYCLPPQKSRATQLASFARLAFQVGLVFVVSFAPFIGQFTLLVRRLFPFQRGLSHAYWAPNVWAIYNFLDRIACRFSSSTGCSATRTTGGLVQQFDHHVLPSIRPFVCSALTLLSILVSSITAHHHDKTN